MSAENEFVTIAKLGKPQGRHGEISAELFTDFPERFADRRHLLAWFGQGERRELELEEFWPHKGRMILKFAGVDSINDAEPLNGAELQIPAAERAKLEEGAIYISELKGCQVHASSGAGSQEVGRVEDVIFGAGEAPLLIVKNGPREFMIPFVESFVTSFDTSAKRIEMQLPEGLLELDAPLSKEEKEAQHRGDRE